MSRSWDANLAGVLGVAVRGVTLGVVTPWTMPSETRSGFLIESGNRLGQDARSLVPLGTSRSSLSRP